MVKKMKVRKQKCLVSMVLYSIENRYSIETLLKPPNALFEMMSEN